MNRKVRTQRGGGGAAELAENQKDVKGSIEAENPKPVMNPDAPDIAQLEQQVAMNPTCRLPMTYRSNFPIYANYASTNVGHEKPTLSFRNRGL